MATIIEGALFTLTEEAAERMVENGLIVKCIHEHIKDGINVVDKPIYHVANCAPDWFGFSTIPGAIIAAENHALEENNDKGKEV